MAKGLATLRRLACCRKAVAAVEFAIVAPVLLLVLAGATNFGIVFYRQINADEVVSSAAMTAMLNGAGLSSSNVDSFAETVAKALWSSQTADQADVSFEIAINGSRLYTFKGRQETASGSLDAADQCRCPQAANGAINWGSAVACGEACPDGNVAGKYAALTYNVAYTPIFSDFGLVGDGGITVRSFVLVD